MPSHLCFELLRLVEDGEIPWSALTPALMGHRTSIEDAAASDRLARRVRALRRQGSPLSHLVVALGLVPEPAAAPGEEASRAALLAALRDAPRERRQSILLKHHRLVRSHPPLLAALLAESKRRLGSCLEDAASWLDLAREVMNRQRGPHLPPEVRTEGELLWLAHEANLLRARGDLSAAAERFEALHRSPLRLRIVRAAAHVELWCLEASLRTDLRQFSKVDELLSRAEVVCRASNDSSSLAKILIKQGYTEFHRGAPVEAVNRYRKAAILLDPEVDPILYWTCHHNLADSLIDLGELEQAETTLAKARITRRRCIEPAHRLRLQWLEARLARAQEHLADAARRMRRVTQDCLDLGLEYDAALAFLDLAEIRLAQGKTREVQRLTAAMEPVFRSKQVHREANAALLLFREAVEAERLDAAFLVELRRYLLLARNDRDFAFRPGAAMAPEVR